jgi:hypothetical protein
MMTGLFKRAISESDARTRKRRAMTPSS